MAALTHRMSLRVSPTFSVKAKVAAASSGVPLGVLLESLLDAQEKRRSRMPSPLHRVGDDDDD
jgi:hypothetical protein